VAHLRMARGADVVMFDPGLGRIYIACSSGAISVFQMDDPAHFRKLEDVAAEPKIHSLAVDLRTHRVYAPAEEEKGRPASKMFVFEAVPNQKGRARHAGSGVPCHRDRHSPRLTRRDGPQLTPPLRIVL